MKIEKKELEKNMLELTIEITREELQPFLKKTSEKLSRKTKIPGFRPGKVPYETIKNVLGEMNIYQEALNNIINETYYEALKKEKIEAVGQPKIKVEKMAPGNPLIYTAQVALLPKVELGNWQNKKIEKKEIKVSKEEIEKTIKQLKEMNVKETIAKKKIEKGDKVEVDFEVSIAKVIIEGGKNNKYPLIIGEGRMIPGFEDKIMGLKANDEIEFILRFPKKYFQKNLANKKADFKVKIINVYQREIQESNNDFAQSMGFESMTKLNKKLGENIKKDKENKEEQRWEREIIEYIIQKSKLEDLPEKLIHNETHKMLHELEHSIQQQGMDMAGYLKSIKKTKENLEKDFKPQARERIKAALVLRQISQEEKIKVTDKEIDEYLQKQKEMYKDNKEALKNLNNPNYRLHILNILANKKVIEFIKSKIK